MSKHIVFSEGRIRLCGILDGSLAMEVVNRLRDQGNREIVLDFSEVEGFEAFGVEVLLRQLRDPGRPGSRVRCCGLPPCLAERVREAGIAVALSPRHQAP
ncbi:MAG: STAS domain-containing protein [Candidatus Methylomirabilia bacterium]